MTEPYVSVVIPTWNRADVVADCVEAVLAQDYPTERYELIVVDDGSTDGAAALLDPIAESRPDRFRLVRQDHRGLNAGRNNGIEHARGELIAYLDDDALPPPGWLRALVAGYLRDPEAGCYAGRIRIRFEAAGPRRCGREPLLSESELDLGEDEKDTAWGWGANLAITRAAIARVGPFAADLPSGGEEMEWQLRHRTAGGRVRYLPDAWVWHRRTVRDLAWRSSLARRYRRGRGAVVAAPYVGERYTVVGELARVPRNLAHAARHRCFEGLLEATMRLGHVRELVSEDRRRGWRTTRVRADRP